MLQLLQAQSGLVPSALQQAPQQQPAAPAQTEASLAQQLAAWPKAQGPFEIERFRDGFSIAGQRVLDPEGPIVQYAVDATTGDYGYLVQALPGQYVLKLSRHQAGASLTVANVTRQGMNWMVQTASGVRLNGSRMILTARGLMVARDNAIFGWSAGAGLQSFSAPETHILAAHQNGDVGATGWVLLEKRLDAKQQEAGALGGTALGDLLGSVRRLGAAVGMAKSDTDYALYQPSTGKLVPLGIAMEEKAAQFMSQCRQKNRWMSTCERMDSVDSLYGQDGRPNRGHYFWRVAWYGTPQGPVAVAMEGGMSRIEALQLATGQRATVFERALGIADWSARQSADGRIRVQAQLGLDNAVKEDVAQLLSAAEAAAAAQ